MLKEFKDLLIYYINMVIEINKNNVDQYIKEKKMAREQEEEIINKRRLLIREQQKKEIVNINNTPDINKIHVINNVIVFPDTEPKD